MCEIKISENGPETVILFDNLIRDLYNEKKGFNNGEFFPITDAEIFCKRDWAKDFHQMYGADNSEGTTQQEKTKKDSFSDSALCSDLHCRSAV